jgi:hypothetical protein
MSRTPRKQIGMVTNSVEFGRISSLPRRVLDLGEVDDVTSLFQRPGGTMELWPIQSAALVEAAKANGLFAPIGVGFGKTLISLALPEAMDSKCAVLLVPPALKRQLAIEIETIYGKHFDLPLDRLRVVAYSELSSAKQATILEDISPDLIIADEAHSLRHRSSARTKRFLRYMKEHPECRFAALSGTMTNRSIIEYAHLLELALRKNSPLPKGYRELRDWAAAIDVKPEYTLAPGVLRQFGDDVRDGFRRRLTETEGVVATAENELGTSLIVRRLKMALPPEVHRQLALVRKSWVIGEEELSSILELFRVLRQLACGFYYHWVWPDGVVDTEWLEARAEWNKEVRDKLRQSREGLDSPLLLAQAAERHRKWDLQSTKLGQPLPKPKNMWPSKTWPMWRRQKHKKPPPTEAVWIDDFVVRAAIKWARSQDAPAIIWYEHEALGRRIAEDGHFPQYGAGTDASQSTERIIVASMKVQGTGKNLQHFCRNLYTSLPLNGTQFEQVTGRTHRPGQKRSEVIVDWFGHTPETEEALAKVIDDAEYMQETTGQRQKILYANRIF